MTNFVIPKYNKFEDNEIRLQRAAVDVLMCSTNVLKKKTRSISELYPIINADNPVILIYGMLLSFPFFI